ncbi:hypothetical protein OIV83_000093 [Microbotryomycetes sp. JL201]|nr:hypothetical protein OIV83_000093 [Microbotryomycetes sp. JL201]
MNAHGTSTKDRRKSAPGLMSKPPTSSLLSTPDPAALVVSTNHVFRSASMSPTLLRSSPVSQQRDIKVDVHPLWTAPKPHGQHGLKTVVVSDSQVANAWCGGNTTTLEFAMRNNDKELERQERARLARAQMTPGEERISSDGSHKSIELQPGKSDNRRPTLPASSNRRVFSVSTFPTQESQQQEEFVFASSQSRGRSREVRENVRTSRPFIDRISAKISHTSLRSHMWPGASSLHGKGPLSSHKTTGKGNGAGSTHVRSQTPPHSTAGHTPKMHSLAKRLSTTALRMLQHPQTRSATQPPPSPQYTTALPINRPNSIDGPIVMRGFDAPGVSDEQTPASAKTSKAELTQRLGISDGAWHNGDSARIARGRAGSIVKRSDPSPSIGSSAETELRINRDLIKLYSRKRVSSPERRRIEARLAGKYHPPPPDGP